MEGFGKELILDLHNCDIKKFNRKYIEEYLIELCDHIDMNREDLHFWDDQDMTEEEKKEYPHLTGVSAIQFITTSNVTVHAISELKKLYVNVFSCKDFSQQDAEDFTVSFFDGKVANSTFVTRL